MDGLQEKGQQSIDLLYEAGQLLQTGLTRDQLNRCISLLQAGERPQAIAAAIKELRRLEATQGPPSGGR